MSSNNVLVIWHVVGFFWIPLPHLLCKNKSRSILLGIQAQLVNYEKSEFQDKQIIAGWQIDHCLKVIIKHWLLRHSWFPWLKLSLQGAVTKNKLYNGRKKKNWEKVTHENGQMKIECISEYLIGDLAKKKQENLRKSKQKKPQEGKTESVQVRMCECVWESETGMSQQLKPVGQWKTAGGSVTVQRALQRTEEKRKGDERHASQSWSETCLSWLL